MTGTTFLQNAYFANHPEIANVGKPRFSADQGFLAVTNSIKYLADAEFDVASCRRLVEVPLADLERTSKVIVWSDENFTSEPSHVTRNATRLRDVVGRARIIVTIREQTDLLQSLFFSRRRKAAAGKANRIPSSIDAWVARELAEIAAGRDSVLQRLDFAAVVRAFEAKFGPENLRIQCFEDLRASQSEYFSDLAAWLGIDPAWRPPANPDEEIAARRRLSHRRARLLDLEAAPLMRGAWEALPEAVRRPIRDIIAGGRKASAPPSPETRRKMVEWLASGNRYIASQYGIPLGAKGYAI